jgi:hypothetical protein
LWLALATPSFAQSYNASWGIGNLDTPLLEKTNGTYGYFGTVAPPQMMRAASTARAASGIFGLRLFTTEISPAQSAQ